MRPLGSLDPFESGLSLYVSVAQGCRASHCLTKGSVGGAGSTPAGHSMPSDTIAQFDFSEALAHLRAGKRVRRVGWDECSLLQGRDRPVRCWIELDPEGALVMECPGPTRILAKWGPGQVSILATDWVLVEEEADGGGI